MSFIGEISSVVVVYALNDRGGILSTARGKHRKWRMHREGVVHCAVYAFLIADEAINSLKFSFTFVDENNYVYCLRHV